VAADPLDIYVDTDVQMQSVDTPKKIVEALRRELRQLQKRPAGTGPTPKVGNLIKTKEGRHLVPQGMLGRLTDICHRHGIAYNVVDRRAMVSCPAIRCTLHLKSDQQLANRRLLLKDSGVLVAPRESDRLAVAAELLARRQQRCLILVRSAEQVDSWLNFLRTALKLDGVDLVTHRQKTGQSRVVLTTYQRAAGLASDELRHGYGMVIFDGLGQVEQSMVMSVSRSVGARYQLGLSDRATREDGLEGVIFACLGGIAHTLLSSKPDQLIRLAYRAKESGFDYPYEGRVQYQALLAALASDEERNKVIIDDVVAEAAGGKACLVLSERRDHLDALATRLPSTITSEQLTSDIRPAERTRVLHRFNNGETQVLFSTGQLAIDALDSQRVERLFFCFPIAYGRKLEKLVGLLARPFANKEDGILFDYDDSAVTPLHNSFEKRKKIVSRFIRAAEKELAQKAQLSLVP
jgi:superfamily II DNA or RNA helicase